MKKENTFKIEFCCLALFTEFLENERIEYMVDIDKIYIYFDRYVMNPHGFHVGYETYKLTLPIYDKDLFSHTNKLQYEYNSYANRIICFEGKDEFIFVDVPESETCNNEDCTEDYCDCELYCSPKDCDDLVDMMYESEVLQLFENFKMYGPKWCFDREKGWFVSYEKEEK